MIRTSKHIAIRAGATEPLEMQLTAEGLDDLESVVTARIFIQDEAEETHVDGDLLTIVSSPDRIVRFDPVDAKVGGGNAFDEPGTYRAYIELTHIGGRTTHYPGNESRDLVAVVSPVLE